MCAARKLFVRRKIKPHICFESLCTGLVVVVGTSYMPIASLGVLKTMNMRTSATAIRAILHQNMIN